MSASTPSLRKPVQVQLPKLTGLQAYQVILYSRALHPELFQLRSRRVYKRGDYELEAWLMPGMHVLRFDHKNAKGAHSICELLTDHEKSPASGVVSAFLAAGERDFEHRFGREGEGLTYMTSVQTETLSPNVFSSTLAELADIAQSPGAVAFRWTDDTGPCISVVDVQEYNHEVHAQCYHAIAHGGLVLRTQSIFEHQ